MLVVLQAHAGREQLAMKLRIGVLVAMREDDLARRCSVADENGHLFIRLAAAGRVRENRAAGLPLRNRRRYEALALGGRESLGFAGDFDHTGANGQRPCTVLDALRDLADE